MTDYELRVMHNLAMLGLQSTRYRDDMEFRMAVDYALAITKPHISRIIKT